MKKANGFTLIEVMMALAIVGFVFSAVLALQLSLTRTTLKSSQRFDRLWNMSLFLRQASLRPPPLGHRRTKSLMNPPLRLSYERFKPKEASALHEIDNLVIEKVEGRWQGAVHGQFDSLATITWYNQDADNDKVQKKKS